MSTVPDVGGAAIDAQNPWPGLSSFDEAAQRFFSGRDAESADLLRLTGQAPLTVLFGKSGLGKTSLLQAGLFPRLRQRNVLPVYVRLDVRDRSAPLIQQAAAALTSEVVRRDVDAAALEPGVSLWEHLHRGDTKWWTRRNEQLVPLFVFDQFEEVFTLGAENADAVARLRLDLADLVENRIPEELAGRLETGTSAEHLDLRGQRYRVLLSFREDFLPDVEGWKSELPSVMRNRLRLLPMSADHAWQVVSGHTPAGRTHELVSDETARDIVRFVAAAQIGDDTGGRGRAPRSSADLAWERLEIEPALLSLVCAGLNDQRKTRGQPTIDAALLKEAGESIIGDFYQRCVADVPDKTRRFIEDALITEGGYRNSHPLQDALDQGLLTAPLLRQLVDRRLLRVDHQFGADRVELIHDRLTDVVRTHRDTERGRVRARRQRRLLAVAALVVLALSGVGLKFYLLWQQAKQALEEVENKKKEVELQKVAADAARVVAEQSEVKVKESLNAVSRAREAEADAAAAATRAADAARAALVDAVAGKLVMQSRIILEGQTPTTPDVALMLAAAGFRLKPDNDAYSGLHHALTATWGVDTIVGVSGSVSEVSPDGQLAVTSRSGNSLKLVEEGLTDKDDHAPRLWDTKTGRLRGAPLRGHTAPVWQVAFAPDGRTLASASFDKTVRLWNATTGAPLRGPLQGHRAWLRAVAFSPDGTLLASGGGDIRLWDVGTGESRWARSVRENVGVWSVAFSPDGKTVVAGGADGAVYSWDVASGVAGPVLEGPRPLPVSSVAFSPDGTTIAAGVGDGTLRFLDVATGQGRAVKGRHDDYVWSVAFSRDGKMLVSGGHDRTVRLWNVETGEASGVRRGHTDAVRSVRFSDNGKTIVSGSDDGTIRRRQVVLGPPAGTVLVGHTRWVDVVAFSRDGKTIVSSGRDALRLWDTATRQQRASLVEGKALGWLVFGLHNKSVFSADGREIRLWDVATGSSQSLIKDMDDGSRVALSPDQTTLVSAGWGKTLRVWNVKDRAPRPPIEHGHGGLVAGLAFSPDGRTIFSAGGRSIRAWDVATGRSRGIFPDKHGSNIGTIAVSPDGTTLASGGNDQVVFLWDARTRQLRAGPLPGHSGTIWSFAFSPDGRTVASGSNDGAVRLWDALTGQPRGAPLQWPGTRPGASPVKSIAFSPDGKTLAAGLVSSDRNLILWDAPAAWLDRVCAKVVRNLTHSEWKRYAGGIPYTEQCSGRPVPAD